MFTVKVTSRFKKDYKSITKRGYEIKLLKDVVALLSAGRVLPDKNKDHNLVGDWAEYRECHIESDWLLIYRVDEDIMVLTLARTGTHSDLF